MKDVFLGNKMTGWVWMDEAWALICRWKLDSLCCTFPNITKFNPSKYSQILLTHSNISGSQTEWEHFCWLQSWSSHIISDQRGICLLFNFPEVFLFVALKQYTSHVLNPDSGVPTRLWSSATSHSSLVREARHCTWGEGVNPSSLIEPKSIVSSNHPEMDSRHYNMNAMPQGWLD